MIAYVALEENILLPSLVVIAKRGSAFRKYALKVMIDSI